jgi:hypothetical protein
VPNFTNPFLALGPEIFGNGGSVTDQAERHDHSSPCFSIFAASVKNFYIGAAHTAAMALALAGHQKIRCAVRAEG